MHVCVIDGSKRNTDERRLSGYLRLIKLPLSPICAEVMSITCDCMVLGIESFSNFILTRSQYATRTSTKYLKNCIALPLYSLTIYLVWYSSG